MINHYKLKNLSSVLLPAQTPIFSVHQRIVQGYLSDEYVWLRFNKLDRAELGQAQLKMGFGFNINQE